MGKSRKLEPVKCFDCRFAYLMKSSPINPVVSLCERSGVREVASSLIKCEHFKERSGEVKINPMIRAK